MKRTASLLLLAASLAPLAGQNLLDGQGRKTGPWKEEYPNGNVMYEGTFREGKPVGEMVRYYDSGAIRARLLFGPGGERSRASLYHENGRKAAEGIYVDRKKDSVWTYFSPRDSRVISREHYRGGVLHGPSVRYYESGQPSDSVGYENGIKEGMWYQFFQNGAVRLQGAYRNGRLEGPYTVYHNDSTLMLQGQYLSGLSTGTWRFYSPSGEPVFEADYRNGSPVNREEYLRFIEDSVLRGISPEEPAPGKLF